MPHVRVAGVMQGMLALISPQSATVDWYVVRGSGFAVYLLLSSAVILGLLLALGWRTDAWPRMITEELHRYIMLVAGCFLALHILSTLLDSFVHFQLYQVLIPFTSGYRPIWLSLGIIAMYLGAALWLSVYLRGCIGYRAWRTLHYAGFAAWLMALVHGITTGTDTRTAWAIAVYAGTTLAIAGLVAVRFGGLPLPVSLGQPPAFRPDIVKWLGAGLAVAALLVALGPMRPGWASWAGTPRVSASAAAPKAITLPASPFQEDISGQATTSDPAGFHRQFLLNMHLTGHGSFPVTLSYGLFLQDDFGGASFDHGVFSLAPANLAWNCSGDVTYQDPNTLQSTCTLPGGQTLVLSFQFNLDGEGNVTGQLTGTPGDGAPSSGSDNQTGFNGA